MPAASELLKQAEHAARHTDAWADLSNFLFNPEDGLIAKAYPTRESREAYVQTEEYRKIRRLITDAAKRSGLSEDSAPKKSGRFLVRLPSSLHVALEREAAAEGVSLNQLVLAKLAAQLSEIVNKAGCEKSSIIQAFLEVRQGYSADKVIADPELNGCFLRRSRELGVPGSDFELNWFLMNARKNGLLPSVLKTKRYSAAPSDPYEYACEIAIRHVQRSELVQNERDVSLDKIICDPALARVFDETASRLGPGYTPLDYRWTALDLRKASRLKSRVEAVAELPAFKEFGAVQSVKVSRIPKEEGIYLFRNECAIFAGETENLRHRIERHFESGGSNAFPDWLYQTEAKTVRLYISPLPNVKEQLRKVLEMGVIRAYKPVFNLPFDHDARPGSDRKSA